ncbi:nitroreductase [Rhodococcus sp. OK519]|nr:nitroreductase [Rhodococcus sp. OK519]
MQRVRTEWLLLTSYHYDAQRFRRNSGVVSRSRAEVLEANIVMDYHRVEKGLTLPEPRAWFGQETVERLVANCRQYAASPDHDPRTVTAAVGALLQYEEAFDDVGPTPQWWAGLGDIVSEFKARIDPDRHVLGGTEPAFDRVARHIDSQGHQFEAIARSRSSVRNFGPETVDNATIHACVGTAQTSPSVCNRQAARVRSYPRGEAATAVLALQNGNRGFGNTASHVLLVTADLTAFLTPGERNQAYIDGGMFAMTLVYALHDSGVDSCCLNWSTVRSQDRKLRKLLNLPEEEVVMMMIAIGFASERSSVTKSPQRAVNRVYLNPASSDL